MSKSVNFVVIGDCHYSKKGNYNKRNAKLVGALENSSQQAVINENADALRVLRENLEKAGK